MNKFLTVAEAVKRVGNNIAETVDQYYTAWFGCGINERRYSHTDVSIVDRNTGKVLEQFHIRGSIEGITPNDFRHITRKDVAESLKELRAWIKALKVPYSSLLQQAPEWSNATCNHTYYSSIKKENGRYVLYGSTVLPFTLKIKTNKWLDIACDK